MSNVLELVNVRKSFGSELVLKDLHGFLGDLWVDGPVAIAIAGSLSCSFIPNRELEGWVFFSLSYNGASNLFGS